MKQHKDVRSSEEVVPLHSESSTYSEHTNLPPPKSSPVSRNIFLVLFLVSAAINGVLSFLLIKSGNAANSTYANLARDIPVKYNSHSPFGLGSPTEAERSIVWEELDTSSGEISLDQSWADSHGLPKSAPFFWDENRDIYLLNGHHSLHCMRKVRRSITLFQYGKPQMDSYPHLVHCMDHLVQNILCEADDTPFYTSTTSNITTGKDQVRMCRSWDRLTDWATEQTACFGYINETQGVNAVIERFRYCPKDSNLLAPMREYFGYPDDWFAARPNDIETMPHYWEDLE